jgi:hypothetical protein
MSNKRNKKKNSLPTTVELFQGNRSEIALSAIQRSGGGFHADKRDRKERKDDWRREEW